MSYQLAWTLYEKDATGYTTLRGSSAYDDVPAELLRLLDALPLDLCKEARARLKEEHLPEGCSEYPDFSPEDLDDDGDLRNNDLELRLIALDLALDALQGASSLVSSTGIVTTARLIYAFLREAPPA